MCLFLLTLVASVFPKSPTTDPCKPPGSFNRRQPIGLQIDKKELLFWSILRLDQAVSDFIFSLRVSEALPFFPATFSRRRLLLFSHDCW